MVLAYAIWSRTGAAGRSASTACLPATAQRTYPCAFRPRSGDHAAAWLPSLGNRTVRSPASRSQRSMDTYRKDSLWTVGVVGRAGPLGETARRRADGEAGRPHQIRPESSGGTNGQCADRRSSAPYGNSTASNSPPWPEPPEPLGVALYLIRDKLLNDPSKTNPEPVPRRPPRTTAPASTRTSPALPPGSGLPPAAAAANASRPPLPLPLHLQCRQADAADGCDREVLPRQLIHQLPCLLSNMSAPAAPASCERTESAPCAAMGQPAHAPADHPVTDRLRPLTGDRTYSSRPEEHGDDGPGGQQAPPHTTRCSPGSADRSARRLVRLMNRQSEMRRALRIRIASPTSVRSNSTRQHPKPSSPAATR